MNIKSYRLRALILVWMVLLFTADNVYAYRQVPPNTAEKNVCTSFSSRMLAPKDVDQSGLLSDIYYTVTKTVNETTEKLFNAFTGSESYQYAVFWAMTLMITLYGVGFTIGIVQPSFQQALIRLIKLSIVMALISPGGWAFFRDNMVVFFQDGTDDIIKTVQYIGTGVPIPPGATPFYVLDRIAEFIIHPDTIVMIMGTLATGPFGLAMSGLSLIAVWGFLMLLIRAMQYYALSFVARAMILGVAPIFFVFLLFDRTKGMFVAWVNALVNLSLQPILLFTFLSFFIVMIDSASKNMLSTELCWQEFKNVEGNTNPVSFWRFTDPEKGINGLGDYTFEGSLECLLLPENKTDPSKCKDFPVNILDILSFLILVYLAVRFTEVVVRISSELSNALVSLDSAGRLDQMLSSKNQSGGGGIFGSANIKQGGGTSRRR